MVTEGSEGGGGVTCGLESSVPALAVSRNSDYPTVTSPDDEVAEGKHCERRQSKWNKMQNEPK